MIECAAMRLSIMQHRDPFARWFAQKQKLLAEDKNLPHLPVIEISDADPPAFRKDKTLTDLHRNNDPVEKLEDFIDVKSWLGCYNTDKNRITIWRRGVELASHRIRCEYRDLLDLVFAHELGHWFHDKAETANGESWDTSVLKDATEEYHEAWAQWFTWLYATEHGGYLCKAFEDLEKRQSRLYGIWSEVFGRKNISAEDQRALLGVISILQSKARKTRGQFILNKAELEGAICLRNVDCETRKPWEDIVPHL